MRRKRWLPLMVIWLGVLWLLQSMVSLTADEHGMLVTPQRVDLGSIPAGESRSRVVTMLNMSRGWVDVEVEPSCGCTVADLSRDEMSPWRVRRFTVQINTEGMAPGVYGRVVRLRFRRSDEHWKQEILFRFSVPVSK